VTDTVTGLIWLAHRGCLLHFDPVSSWAAGNQAAEAVADSSPVDCLLTDGSSPGDWRLPTRDEISSMFAPFTQGCFPGFLADDGVSCVTDAPSSFITLTGPEGPPECNQYWAGTADKSEPFATTFFNVYGSEILFPKDYPGACVWPVRSPPPSALE